MEKKNNNEIDDPIKTSQTKRISQPINNLSAHQKKEIKIKENLWESSSLSNNSVKKPRKHSKAHQKHTKVDINCRLSELTVLSRDGVFFVILIYSFGSAFELKPWLRLVQASISIIWQSQRSKFERSHSIT